MNNIKDIGNDCSHCGFCNVVCPKTCINYTYSERTGDFEIRVDENKCIDCGICRKVCPVINQTDTESDFCQQHSNDNVYAVHSTNTMVRKESASGGFITSFLCYLLNKGIIDGTLISKRDSVTGNSFIAKTEKEILESKTSIYAPVNYTLGLKELKETNCKKIAVVGLPCHINAIHNWKNLNKKVNDKIALTISIVCGKTPTTNAYKYIANQNGFDYHKILHTKNRGDGWPGFMEIKHKDGIYKVPYRSQMSMGMVLSSPLLSRNGCTSCLDGFGKHSDIAVCDAWLPQYTQMQSDGWNLILAQTEKAKQILSSDNISEYLHLENESVNSFYIANKRVIDKHFLNNDFRQKKYRSINSIKTSTKQKLYVKSLNALKDFTKNKDKATLNPKYLLLGKIINKLKD